VKRLLFAALFLAGCGALYALQRSRASAPVNAQPVMYLVADSEREADRIPLAVTRVSDQEEIKVGRQLAIDYGLNALPRDEERWQIASYLNSVGIPIASHVQRSAIPYIFYLDNNRSLVNAYAIPGGHIVVGRGLLELMESEDELAAVLGHEIAHVDNRHAIGSLQYQLASRKLGLGSFYALGAPAVQLFEAGYTKEQELEADRVGLDLAVASGYSPAGAINIMKCFEQLEPGSVRRAGSPVEEAAEVPFSALQEYFRSHPPAAERRAAVENEIAIRGWNSSAAVRPMKQRLIFLSDAADNLNRAGDFQASIARYKEAVAIDPGYVRGWRGLARAAWRSGDALETVQAETEAVRRNAMPPDWTLLAQALSASDSKNALRRLAALESDDYGKSAEGDPNNPSHRMAKVNEAGLQFVNGNKDAFDHFQTILDEAPAAPEIRSAILSVMAGWMYRAGKLDLAREQLETAHQILPQDEDVDLQLAWVLSDLGRQADALANISAHNNRAERFAVLAVVDWQTGERDAAAAQFQSAAREDPVWMVPKWVENSYSSTAAGVIKQLQAAEAARRLKEAQERQRLAAQH
jgi:predicted Zn-dependent protease